MSTGKDIKTFILLIFRKMKITMEYHLTPVRLTNGKNKQQQQQKERKCIGKNVQKLEP